MAVRLVIGGFDLSSYIRLPPGEEFDPSDNDFLEEAAAAADAYLAAEGVVG